MTQTSSRQEVWSPGLRRTQRPSLAWPGLAAAGAPVPSTNAGQGPNGAMVAWHGMVAWRQGGMAAWRHGVMASWWHGGMVAWCHGGMAAWWHDDMVAWWHVGMVSLTGHGPQREALP